MSALDPIKLRQIADSDLSTIERRARAACGAAYDGVQIFAITGDKILGVVAEGVIEVDYRVQNGQIVLGGPRPAESLIISEGTLEMRRRQACLLAAERCMLGDAAGAAAALSPFIGGKK